MEPCEIKLAIDAVGGVVFAREEALCEEDEGVLEDIEKAIDVVEASEEEVEEPIARSFTANVRKYTTGDAEEDD